MIRRGTGSLQLTALDKIQSLPDPLLSFKWVATYLPYGMPVEYLQAISLPFTSIEIGELEYSTARFIQFPSTMESSPANITMYEDSNGKALQWLEFWRNRVVTPQGFYGLPGLNGTGYKQKISIALLDVKNNPVITVNLIDSWPYNVSALDLSYTASESIKISFGLAVDRIETTFHYKETS